MATLAATLFTSGAAVLIFKATQRGDLSWWTDPVFWIGALGMAVGALMFLWLLVPPWLTDRQTRHERVEQLLHEGRANQFQGLDEIARELGEISSLLKQELRWGKRGPLFPNTAWAKNRHLVTGDTRTLVENAYERAHLLDQETISAKEAELNKRETEERQAAKQAVDAAGAAVSHLRDEVEL